MYKPVPNKVEFTALERDVLKFWEDNRIFEKSLTLSDKESVFYDGPPFPTGAPHFGTVFVSILKDALARYFTMAGYSVPRKWGWDCHGLPIENEVEKKLGITDKTEIEKNIGIKKFNDECRKLVSDCNDSWENYIRKIGRWVDYKNAYRTLDLNFMESTIWVFKQCFDKGLIYKDYRVTPYCCRCETALSISDTRESDSTRPRQDPEVTVRFKACDSIADLPTYYLAWTTTPWTLISNMALAVGSDFNYVAVKHDGNAYVMIADALKRYEGEFGKKPEIIAEFKGSHFAGKRYEPLFPYFGEAGKQGAFRILEGDFVATDEGVGIVHIAPAFGEDDYWLCKRNGIGVKNPVDSKGRFSDEIPEYSGRNVLECNKDIIHRLKEQGSLIKHRTIEHNYPHCWRCRQPLIYRAMDAWYFAVEEIRDRLVERNMDINWVPEHLKTGRFGKWLAGARDWNISRSRYWGTPIPVWDCENPDCDNRFVPGAIAEIEAFSGTKITDLHKESLDAIAPSCEKCGGVMRRVPDVLDCWFESGSMPFGQCHYPFENKEWFESHFPADFIVEYPGQIRGWFYYLHVLAVAILDRISFKNCLVHGTLLAADGSKISKSKKNFTDPMVLIDRYGADALRIYLLSSPAVVMEDMNFKDAGVVEQIKNVLLPVWNSYSFLVTYANIDNYAGDPELWPDSESQLDKWILAELFNTEKKVSGAYSSFYLNHSLNPILDFIDNLTNWYIRRSRARFWADGMSADKKNAYNTLYCVLVNLLKLMAPAAPFISETIYRNITGNESIHLSKWPDIPERYKDDALIEKIKAVRIVSSLGLALRQAAGIKVRQPLASARVALPPALSSTLDGEQLDVLSDELNVKKIELMSDPGLIAEMVVKPNPKILGPKLGKDMQKVIAAARAGNIRDNGETIIIVGDREWELARSDVEILYQGKDGLNVMSEKGIVVSLDTKITDELREEGVANELNRAIQELRKTAGYNVSDRIFLDLKGDLSVFWQNHLASNALAELSDLKEGFDEETSLEVDNRSFTMRIKKR